MNSRRANIAKEYAAGLAGGLLLGGAAFLLGNTVFKWAALALGGIAVDLFALFSILLLFAAAAVGAGEPIYRLGKREHAHWGRRARIQLWKGGFLGPAFVIALLQIMELNWKEIAQPPASEFILSKIFRVLIAGAQYIFTAPFRLLVHGLNIPSEVPILLAIPVGALLIRYFHNPSKMRDPMRSRNAGPRRFFGFTLNRTQPADTAKEEPQNAANAAP